MPQLNNKIKALILLVVFALNTVVSFACSVGLAKLNKDHHDQVSSTSHSHGKSSSHAESKAHTHEDTGSHNHANENTNHQHDHKEDNKSCCSDEVIKFVELDKSVTNANQNPLPLPVELMAALYTFLVPDYSADSAIAKPKHPANRSWDLANHIDLRIVIQSFQI